MSKKSAASLSVVPVTALGRIEAPSTLSASEKALWERVVDSKPAEWFGADSVPLLIEYVRCAGECDTLHDMVVQALTDGDDVPVLKDVMKLRDMASRRLLSIGTKLRLTQQSRYNPGTASTATAKTAARKPWAARS